MLADSYLDWHCDAREGAWLCECHLNLQIVAVANCQQRRRENITANSRTTPFPSSSSSVKARCQDCCVASSGRESVQAEDVQQGVAG